MTLTFELDVDGVKVNQRAKYIDQMSFSLKVRTHGHTHRVDCSTWTTKVVGSKRSHEADIRL